MKWWGYLICIALIISGVFCGIGLIKQIKAESYINGTLTDKNEFSQENFHYTTTQFTMYHDAYDETDTYYYDINLTPVEDFDGECNDYELYVNNYRLFDVTVNFGSINANMPLNFYDVYSEVMNASNIKINLSFYANKTNLNISVIGFESSKFVTSYFVNNGLNIFVKKI